MEKIKKTRRKNLTEEEKTEYKKQYYKDYYIRKKREQGLTVKETRGRKPKPKPTPFTIIRFDSPLILHFN